jgi:hypothetical protein
MVTGTGNPGDPTNNDDQNETSVAVSNFGTSAIATMTYNDGTGNSGKIVYTQTTRQVYPGASLLGWSYMTFDPTKSPASLPTTWTYGGKVSPPSGWAVLWGDPSTTVSQRNPNYKFITNLAVPSSRVPAVGYFSGELDSAGAVALGGACIAISSDGGKTFAIDAPGGVPQCPTNNGDFYDGSSMASLGNGTICAAYNDVTFNHIDVWCAPSETSAFTMLPDPFPGTVMSSHPRLRAGVGSNTLYVAAQDDFASVWMNQWNGSSWGTATSVTTAPTTVYPTVYPGFVGAMLRTGPQFSFDVGQPSQNGDDAIRLAFVWQDSQNLPHLGIERCTLSLSCQNSPEWSTGPNQSPSYEQNITFDTGEDQEWQPAVVAVPSGATDANDWVVFLYQSNALARPNVQLGGYSLSVSNGGVLPAGTRYLGGLVNVESPFPTEPPCSDLRGQWGDYFGAAFASNSVPGGTPYYIASGEDSRPSCSFQAQFTAAPKHVGFQFIGDGF